MPIPVRSTLLKLLAQAALILSLLVFDVIYERYIYLNEAPWLYVE